MKKEDLDFINRAVNHQQCYNCALRKQCEAEDPNSYEPIGTCSNWKEDRK